MLDLYYLLSSTCVNLSLFHLGILQSYLPCGKVSTMTPLFSASERIILQKNMMLCLLTH